MSYTLQGISGGVSIHYRTYSQYWFLCPTHYRASVVVSIYTIGHTVSSGFYVLHTIGYQWWCLYTLQDIQSVVVQGLEYIYQWGMFSGTHPYIIKLAMIQEDNIFDMYTYIANDYELSTLPAILMPVACNFNVHS